MNRDRLVDNTGLLEQAWGLEQAGWGGGGRKKYWKKIRSPEGDLIFFQPRGAIAPSVDLYSEGGVAP